MSTTSYILLCGGQSQRNNFSPKGLRLIQNKSWLNYQIEKIESFPQSNKPQIIIVLGHQSDLYLNSNASLCAALKLNLFFDNNYSKLKCLINTQPQWGPFSSLNIALNWLIDSKNLTKNTFILPIDCPCPEWNTIQKLIPPPTLAATHQKARLPTYKNKGGHPLWISKQFAFIIAKHPPSHRLDYLVRQLEENEKQRVLVNDPLVVYNLNTPSQWDSFLKELNIEQSSN